MKLLISILLLMISAAHAEQFQAPLTKTEWQVTSEPLQCVLSQHIDGFGVAKFSRKTGGPFSLIFTSRSHPSEAGVASFEIAQAPWQNSEEREVLKTVHIQKNQRRFEITGDLAKEALTHIQEGRFPTLRYSSHNMREEISALLSTVHLNDVMPKFEQCLADLHPDTFEDIRKLTVYFISEKSDLSDKSKASLKRIADYVKIDKTVKRIHIDGYTDNFGKRKLNIELSEARALSIKNYLMEQNGIPENLITTAFHREFNQAKTNKTAKGRSYNRRAELEVFR